MLMHNWALSKKIGMEWLKIASRPWNNCLFLLVIHFKVISDSSRVHKLLACFEALRSSRGVVLSWDCWVVDLAVDCFGTQVVRSWANFLLGVCSGEEVRSLGLTIGPLNGSFR